MSLTSLLAVARGAQPADLLLTNARLVNVFTQQIETTAIALLGDRIAGIGAGYTAATVVDLAGAYVTPGLIDAHVHIESSLCTPAQFAAAVLPHGVTTVVTDPHEIANVAGLPGIRFMVEAARALPLAVVFMAPSCVPATGMETSGAALPAGDLATLLAAGSVHGLAEVMNYPGVAYGDPDVLAKLTAFAGRPRDGHAPGFTGPLLNAYVAAGIGSDHECTTVAEAQEKLARGLYILIREATNARNLHALLPLITPATARRICFCTDDRIPADLLDLGSIDYMLRAAIAYGLDPALALPLGTLNAAEWFGLHDRGAIAPGRRADLLVVDDLGDFRPRQVYAGGRLVAEHGALVPGLALPSLAAPAAIAHSVHVAWERIDLRVPAPAADSSATAPAPIRVIGMLPDQLITEHLRLAPKLADGYVVPDCDRDLLKMAVIERHHASGRQGLGFIRGLGLRRGAIAGSVAHDHHNLVAMGADDASLLTALRHVAELGGGLAVADGDTILAALPLPIAGLMSDQPVAAVRAGYDTVVAAAQALGSPLHDPFMAMSFMALEVIPALKLTDHGLVDVERFAPTELFC